MSGDAVVAGRLEIPVESDTTGFAQKLKAAVEKAAEDVVATIGVELDTGALRQKLQAGVAKAAEGITAQIGVDVDTGTLKAKLEAAAKSSGGLKIGTHVSAIGAELRKRLAEAQAQANTNPVVVPVQGGRGNRFLAWLKGYINRAQTMARLNPITVPVRQGSTPNAPGGGGAGGGFQMPKMGGGISGRSAFKPLMYLGIASVIQPAIAAIVGSLGGLVAMASSAAASLNVLGGAGGVLAALGAGFAAVTISVGTLMEGKLEDLPKSLQGMRKEVDAAGESWAGMREKIALGFWSQLEGELTPTTKVLFPLLRDGLAGVSTELGEAAKQTAQWMRTPLFQKQASSIFYTLRTVTDGFGASIVGLLKGFVQITVAAGPMLSKFGDVLRDFGDWAAGIGDTADDQKRLGVAFEYAWTKGAQLWDIAKNLGAALKEMFSAGRTSGDSLLGSLQDVVKEWRAWAESTEGQERIKRWFENVEPIARAAGRLIVDLGKAIGRLSEDATTAGLLEKIRTELLPSLETFLKNLGTTLGPAVITFITNVLEVLTQMSAAGSPLGQGLAVINQLISGLAAVFHANPELAKNVGILLGALLGFRALSFFGNLIPGISGLFSFIKGGGKASFVGAAGGIALFSGALAGLPGPAQGAWAAISTLLTLVPAIKGFSGQSKGLGLLGTVVGNMGSKFTAAKAPIGGFKGSLSGLGAAIGYAGASAGKGAFGAAKGLIGLLGGPWGIALTAAATAVGAFWQAQENAKNAAKELSATLDEQTGAFTDNTRTTIIKNLQEQFDPKDWADLEDSLQAAGVGMDDFIRAYEQGGPAIDTFKSKFEAWQSSAKAGTWNPDEIARIEALGNTYASQGRDLDGARVAADNLRGAQDGLKDSSGSLGEGIAGVASQITGALFPTESLADALERITGVTLSAREADRRYEEAKASLATAIQKGDKVIKDSTGSVTNATEAGRRYNDRLDNLATAAVRTAEADLKQGAAVGGVKAKMDAARSSFIENARRMGYSESAARTLADKLGLTATKVDTLHGEINGLPSSKWTTVGVHNLASGVIAGIKQSLAGLTSKVFTIGAAFGWRHGGIQEFFEGGIRGLNSYATGKLPRDAMIARDGANLVNWAEKGTGGEAFIPMGAQNRPRSMKILDEVARRFGMALTPVANGLARNAAPGAGALLPAGAPGAGGAPLMQRAAPQITFAEGAFQINNPAPEPAGRSAADALRSVGEWGLFGEDA